MLEDIGSLGTRRREPSRRCPACGRVQSGANAACNRCHRFFDQDATGGHGASVDRWRARLGPTPDAGAGTAVGATALLAVMLWLGWGYASGSPLFDDQRSPSLLHQLIDMADLVFHEAGHWILAPLGRFLSVAGGSLFEVGVPATCAYGLLRHGDRLGAAFGTWWTGQALARVAVYAGDARAQRLVLLHGGTGRDAPGTHDWNNLLGWTGLLEHDHALAWTLHLGGVLLLAAGTAWGAWIASRAWQATLAGPSTLRREGTAAP